MGDLAHVITLLRLWITLYSRNRGSNTTKKYMLQNLVAVECAFFKYSDVKCKLAGTVTVKIWNFLSNRFCKANKFYGNTDFFMLNTGTMLFLHVFVWVQYFICIKITFLLVEGIRKRTSFICVKTATSVCTCARNHSASVHFRLLHLFCLYLSIFWRAAQRSCSWRWCKIVWDLSLSISSTSSSSWRVKSTSVKATISAVAAALGRASKRALCVVKLAENVNFSLLVILLACLFCTHFCLSCTRILSKENVYTN